VGFVVDKVVLGQVFSEYYGFPCQSSFHQLLHNQPHLSFGILYTVTLKDHLKNTCLNTLNYVYVDENMVLGLFYDTLSTDDFMWYQ
jgi:hypothetical protein